jgi:hypothetical protein
MASFTEQATLKVNDQSSSAIRRINADLAALRVVASELARVASEERPAPEKRTA